MSLSDKQLLSIQKATKRLNLWVGAVRSGKTYASIQKLIFAMRSGVPGAVMLIGVSRESLQRNVLIDLYKSLGFPPPSSKATSGKLYGRDVYFVGAHDESAVRKIQGSSLAYAYVDECVCIPEPFWRMLLSRLSVSGAQLFATGNPEGPQHWIKKNYIDKAQELDLAYFHFVMDDNPSLTEEYKESLKKEYGYGAWYNRLILGLWAIAEGLVFDGFDEMNLFQNTFEAPAFYAVGIDYGTSNATAAVLGAIDPKKWPQIRIEEEYYYDSHKAGRAKSDSELADDIYSWLRYRSTQAIYVDPAAASIKVELRQRGLPVIDAKNEVLEGIRTVSKFIKHKNLVVHKGCKNLIESIESYVWDRKASDRGEDKPLKVSDHCVDSLRYLVASVFKTGIIEDVSSSITIDQVRKQIYGETEPLFGDGFMSGGYF